MNTSSDPLGPKERGLFVQALEHPTAQERVEFLDKACAGDTALRGRLQALLERFERLGTFLESPVIAAGAQARGIVTATGSEVITEQPGDTIGHYRLLQKIGEGGCGVVYMAEQAEPVRRRVALKIVKLGLDTKSVIARFEAERQALALMDHPNIAKVLDAGSTERPLTRPSGTLSPVGGEGKGEGDAGCSHPSDTRT